MAIAQAPAALEKLRAELSGLGVTEAYEIGDGVTLCVWLGLVVTYRDGFYHWWEGSVRLRHLASDPTGCATRLARRYTELRRDAPLWWDEISHLRRDGP